MLDRLRSQLEADFAAWYEVRETSDGVCFGRVVAAGPPAPVAAWSGQCGARFDGLWSPGRPGAARDRFVRGHTQGHPFTARHYEPHGLRWQRRMLVYDGANCAGWIGVLRFADHRDFTGRELARLRHLSEPLADVVRTISRLRAAPLSDPSTRIVLVTEEGRVEHACAGVLRRDDIDEIASSTRAGRERVVLDGRIGRRVRLVGDGTGPRYVWLLERTEPPQLDAAQLTPQQRAVAEGAARGRSTAGVAAALGLSVETVKQHLDAAYRRLGVGSRVELRQALLVRPCT